mmetsp:Transcript_22227/g.32730  ORF Transcript_22227/g.32730 Transcript_22227/m.32730 type:complete len:205 (+) Transcript_22227:39-653(+)
MAEPPWPSDSRKLSLSQPFPIIDNFTHRALLALFGTVAWNASVYLLLCNAALVIARTAIATNLILFSSLDLSLFSLLSLAMASYLFFRSLSPLFAFLGYTQPRKIHHSFPIRIDLFHVFVDNLLNGTYVLSIEDIYVTTLFAQTHNITSWESREISCHHFSNVRTYVYFLYYPKHTQAELRMKTTSLPFLPSIFRCAYYNFSHC